MEESMRAISAPGAILRQPGISTGTSTFGFAFSSAHVHQFTSYSYSLQLYIMSFGFGVGDFLAVAEISKKIWDRFEKSPSYLKDARQECVFTQLSSVLLAQDRIEAVLLTVCWQSREHSKLHPV